MLHWSGAWPVPAVDDLHHLAIRFTGSENLGTPGSVSQWQKGEFEVVWPKAIATQPLLAPKPPWG